MGIPRKAQSINPKEKLLTAYHEGGHALCGLLTKGSSPLFKISIISRGEALGYTSYLPTEGENLTRRSMIAKIDCLLAGRVGEEILVGKEEVTTGCSDDLLKAT